MMSSTPNPRRALAALLAIGALSLSRGATAAEPGKVLLPADVPPSLPPWVSWVLRGHEPETCAVGALAAWLEASGIESGPVFRSVDRHGRIGTGRLSSRFVAEIVKTGVESVGRDPRAFAGHSLRAGHATAAALAGAHERDIMRQTGHRSVMMLRRYIRDGSLFRSNSAATIGL